MVQSVKHLTLGFGPGRDLTVHETELHVRLCPGPESAEPAWDSLSFSLNLKCEKEGRLGDSVKPLTSAQVMISQFVNSSPMLGSVLTAQSLEPASDPVSQIGRAHV